MTRSSELGRPIPSGCRTESIRTEIYCKDHVMSKTKGKTGPLFAEFPPVSKAQWVEKAKADLKGADFDNRLVWKNLNDIEVQPFYTLEDRKKTLADCGRKNAEVINYRRIQRESRNKNELALQAVSEGIDGILFEVGVADGPEDLLKGLDPEQTALSFDLETGNEAFSDRLLEYYSDLNLNRKKVRGFLETSFIHEFLTQGIRSEQGLDFLAGATQSYADYPRFRTLAVSGREYPESGANQVQEIAFTLNAVVYLAEEMTRRNLGEKLVFDKLNIILATGAEYFVEIAKLRAFRSLLHRVAGKYGVMEPDFSLVSRSSVWNRSVLDPHTNMLRATTEAMSAILGNADALEIDPYDSETGATRELSRRIAGNIAIILREESYFGKVSNPVDGSYYLEELTLSLAEKALDLFKEIETCGGFVRGIEEEVIQNKIALVRTTRLKLLARRRRTLVGVNKYPNLMEEVSKEVLCSEIPSSESKFLRPRRASLEFEVIRSKTEQWVEEKGRRPVVEFAAYGDLAMRKARAGFAYDFLGVGGFEMEEERSYPNYSEAAESSARSGSDLVVICSSDEEYRDTALRFVREFRNLNRSKVLVLAGNPAEIADSLKQAGLDGFIFLGSDVIDGLSLIHKKMERMLKPDKK